MDMQFDINTVPDSEKDTPRVQVAVQDAGTNQSKMSFTQTLKKLISFWDFLKKGCWEKIDGRGKGEGARNKKKKRTHKERRLWKKRKKWKKNEAREKVARKRVG